MPLSQLVYVSRATRPFVTEDLERLVNDCQANNTAQGITGLLLYSGGHFMQCIEGPRVGVLDLYEKISFDPRHHSLQLLVFRPATERMFKQWAMGLLNAEAELPLNRILLTEMLTHMRRTERRGCPDEAVLMLKEFRRQLGVAA